MLWAIVRLPLYNHRNENMVTYPPTCGQLVGPKQGLAPLHAFIRNFVQNVYRLGYADWDTLVDLGAGDALPKVHSRLRIPHLLYAKSSRPHQVLDVLANPGDGILVDAWSHNFSLEHIRSMGIKPVGVDIDAGGLDPRSLDQLLTDWDSEARGCARYIARSDSCTYSTF